MQRWYATLTLLLAGCVGPSVERAPDAPSDPALRRAPALADADVAEVIRLVSETRHLSVLRPIAIELLDRARFLEHYSARHGAAPTGPKLEPESAVDVGFDFLPEPSKRSGITASDDVVKEGLHGFYDAAADKVFVPSVGAVYEKQRVAQRAVLAHEVQHALQARHFPRFRRLAAAGADETLARRALFEGDAVVAEGAYVGVAEGATVGRALRHLADAIRKHLVDAITRREGHEQRARALPITREHIDFPYRDGALFVLDVYRAGGFSLVDRMYESPPRSTEQILHPEKYLAGELPRPVADPRPPPGYTVAAVETLGELDTRILLERCLKRSVAQRAAAGWAGDRFGVFRGSGGDGAAGSGGRRLAVAWISAWDTEQDAAELEDALQKSDACWHDNALDEYAIGAARYVRREGKLVAFLRGYPAGAGEGAAAGLFSLVGPEPARAPLTDLVIPPRVPLPRPQPGSVDGRVYSNDWLGVVGGVPGGMDASLGEPLALAVRWPKSSALGSLTISTRVTGGAQDEKTFRELEQDLVAGLGKQGRGLQPRGGGPVRTSLGPAVERRWDLAGTVVGVRVVLVPICGGTGSIVFILRHDEYGLSTLDGWVDSFHRMGGGVPPVCEYLDPK